VGSERVALGEGKSKQEAAKLTLKTKRWE